MANNLTYIAMAFGIVIIVLAFNCSGTDSLYEDEAPACSGELSPGDLVITEIMANPNGEDAGGEWFEIYNPTPDTVDLGGLTIESAKEDGSESTGFTVEQGVIEAGQYLVFGGILEEVRPEYVDYAYGNKLDYMRNTAGMLAIHCGDRTIDEVIYVDVDDLDGISIILDGRRTPDASNNNSLENWCPSTIEYTAGSLGSPGRANEACAEAGVASTCSEDGVTRDPDSPSPGEMVITEFMANPEKVADKDGEWFEVYVVSDVYLNGLKIGRDPDSVSDTLVSKDCLYVSAGSYIIFARNGDPTENGGIDNVDYVVSFNINNSDSSLFIGVEDTIIDRVTYTATKAGVAASLDPDFQSAKDNDDPENWCDAIDPYGAGDLGTPGEENSVCGTLADSTCMKGGTEREIRFPSQGDLVITEYMANPASVDDKNGEWFEVYVANDVDLNGLKIGRDPDSVSDTLVSKDCLYVSAGSYIIFARNGDPTENGGIDNVDYVVSFNINNSDSSLFIGVEDTIIDRVTYTATKAGVATALDPVFQNAKDNDDPENWCGATDPYGAGDMGTPGTSNSSCNHIE